MLENCLTFAIDSYPARFSTKDIRFSSAKASKLRTNRTGLWLGQWWVTSPPRRTPPPKQPVTEITGCNSEHCSKPFHTNLPNKIRWRRGTNWWQDLINAFLLMNRTFFKFTPQPPASWGPRFKSPPTWPAAFYSGFFLREQRLEKLIRIRKRDWAAPGGRKQETTLSNPYSLTKKTKIKYYIMLSILAD